MQALEAISIEIPVDDIILPGQLEIPLHAQGLVLFVHGAGGVPPSQRVAGFLHDVSLGTLIFDLLAPSEAADAAASSRQRSDVALLARRLRRATLWARRHPDTAELLIGYFGASASTGAVLTAGAQEGPSIGAVVTCGGNIGVSTPTLKKLRSPTLLIVGSNDPVISTHLEAWAQLTCEKSIEIIPGAGPRCEEPGALDNVAALAARWFGEHLKKDLAS